MGEDFDSRLHQQCWPNQPPNLNCVATFVPVQGMQNALPVYSSLYNRHMVLDESPRKFAAAQAQSPQLKTGQTNEFERWFYCLPRHRQALTPLPKVPAKGFSPIPLGYSKDVIGDAEPRPVEKRFLVFDQSGDQTNLIFSSFIGAPNQSPKLEKSEAFRTVPLGEPRITGGPVVSDGNLDNQESGEKSEMHEDTEELNALLYSSEEEEEDDYEDETSSTGHSPSEMEGHQEKEQVNENAEEVGSSGSPPTKRKRQGEEECTSSSLVDTASSGKPNPSPECKDDAESSCGESKAHGKRESESSPPNKRFKRERIRETINILQNIIPGGKGKDAILVLDEAIQYLKSLKLMAKSLGKIYP